MASHPAQAPVTPFPIYSQPISTPAPPSSVWDKITTWASENKTVVYTAIGVTVVVTGAGVAYYLTSDVRCIAIS